MSHYLLYRRYGPSAIQVGGPGEGLEQVGQGLVLQQDKITRRFNWDLLDGSNAIPVLREAVSYSWWDPSKILSPKASAAAAAAAAVLEPGLVLLEKSPSAQNLSHYRPQVRLPPPASPPRP